MYPLHVYTQSQVQCTPYIPCHGPGEIQGPSFGSWAPFFDQTSGIIYSLHPPLMGHDWDRSVPCASCTQNRIEAWNCILSCVSQELSSKCQPPELWTYRKQIYGIIITPRQLQSNFFFILRIQNTQHIS